MSVGRVLVTGGTGAVGVWVLRELLKRNIHPISLSRRHRTELIPDITDQVEFAVADMTDAEAVHAAFRRTRPDAVIHLAASLGHGGSDLLGIVRANADGTYNVMSAAQAVGAARFVYVSSRAIYGAARGDHAHPTYAPVSEEYPTQPHLSHPIRPLSMYGATKLLGECLSLHEHWRSGLDTVVMRLAPCYYPGYVALNGAKAVMFQCQMIENAMLGLPTSVPKGGDQKSDIVYGRDAAWLLVQAAVQERLDQRVYNVASGQATTLKDLAVALKDLYPQVDIAIGPGEDYLGGGNYATIAVTRAREELGYQPQYLLAEAVADYIRTMEQLGFPPTPSPPVLQRPRH